MVKRLKNGVLQWNIELVLLLSRLNNNTSRIFHSKTLKKGVLQWNIELVLLVSRLNNNTSPIFHSKTLKKRCFAMEYRACVTFKST